MAYYASLPLSFLLFTLTINNVFSQITVADNIFDSLEELGCIQFKSIIIAANLVERFKGSNGATLFVFTDETYAALPASRMGTLYEEGVEEGPRRYVQSFTLDTPLETSDFSDARPYLSELNTRGYLFLKKSKLLSGNVASGTAGVDRYFVNGATIVKPNIRAGQHIIHIIDRVLDMPLESNALAYVEGYNPEKTRFRFYTQLMSPLSNMRATDTQINYNTQIRKVLMASQVTFFMPTDQAMNSIPNAKLQELIGQPQKLLEIMALHIVPNKVLFTSIVNHNEPFLTQMQNGKVIFRKNFAKEAVYITGALNGGGTVTARVSPANITIENGVIHQIDQVMGFVYNSAIEEIKTDPITDSFQGMIDQARSDLKNALSASSGVTIFVPTNNAMIAIRNVDENYTKNKTLANMVLQLSLLKPGTPFSLTSYNRGYTSMLEVESRYSGRKIKIYSEGNDTWVEGGYVRARVIKPDIGVTNGFVHQIDAVFGVPTRDIVYTIFCNDWLIRTYEEMVSLKLDLYMRDTHLVKNQQCSFRSGEIASPAGDFNMYSDESCRRRGYKCQFTYFVPNGTAIENFLQRPVGRDMANDPQRWKWLMRRHMTKSRLMFLDQLALGAPHYYTADNGERVRVQVTGRGGYSNQRTVYIRFGNDRAEVLRSDIGATNGVIHIVDKVLFVQDDLYRDVSAASSIQTTIFYFYTITLLGLLLVKY